MRTQKTPIYHPKCEPDLNSRWAAAPNDKMQIELFEPMFNVEEEIMRTRKTRNQSTGVNKLMKGKRS